MNLSEPFIRRPVMTTLVMLAVSFFGALSYQALPVSDLPDVDFPTIEVTVTYPGADPETVANNVVNPLEQQFSSIPGIQIISSQSKTGGATIVLQFSLDRSVDLAAPDVLEGINAASAQLPKDLPYAPTYAKTNPTSTPLLIFALTSDTLSAGDLYDYAYNLMAQRLNMVEGVSQVETWGEAYAVRIKVDPQKLAARKIGLDDFSKAIQDANVYLPTGVLYGPKTEFTIDCAGQIMQADGYNSLVVKTENGTITRVSDVGHAYDSLWNDKFYFHYVNKDLNKVTVGLGIQKQAGANTLKIIKDVNNKLKEIQQELPSSLKLWTVYDQSDYINESVHDVEMTLVIAFLLVVLVIFLYLGRVVNTVIPAVAIPLTLLGAFIAMLMMHFTIDILSLLSLTLAIGFLVDDAIVMLENIARHIESGESREVAALNGSKEISFTILSMTICLAAVFIPLVFMEGIIGRVLHEFALTIVVVILISGFVSFTCTPMLCSKFIASYKEETKKSWVERFSQSLNTRLIKYYKPSLEWALRHRLLVLISALLSLGLTIVLIVKLPKDFLPDDDIGFIQGFVQLPDGASPFGTADVMEEVAKIIQKNPYATQMMSLGSIYQSNQGLFYLRLVDLKKRPPSREVIKILYQELSSITGVQFFLKPLPLINLQVGATAAKGDYQFTLQSFKPTVLYKYAEEFQKQLKTLPSIRNVTSDLDTNEPQLEMQILRDKASLYGITAQQIENALSLAYGEINLSPINEPNNQYYVIMELEDQFQLDPSMLSQIWLRSTLNGNLVALSEVVAMKETTGPLTINHLDNLPSATVTFDVKEGVPLETALNEVEKVAKDLLPPTVFGHIQGTASIFKQSFANLNFLLLITIFLIYVILGILYENFFHPITVMSTLPPAALGGLITLLIFSYSLSLYAFVGIIMLLGIVMKNGIILIDFANESVEKEGKTPDEAILHACIVRFRPILMTTMAALMGALPIAIGIGGLTAQGRKPLGAVIVGGLLFSQILTLFLTPVTYLYIEKLRKALKKKPKAAGGTGQTPPSDVYG